MTREIDEKVHTIVMGLPLGATTPYRIGQAVYKGYYSTNPPPNMIYTWNGNDYSVKQVVGYGELLDAYRDRGIDFSDFPNRVYGLHVWENREGKTYQGDIEKHVREWKEIPPEYSNDTKRLWVDVLGKIVDIGWDFTFDYKVGCGFSCYLERPYYGGEGKCVSNPSMAMCVCLSALNAMESNIDSN